MFKPITGSYPRLLVNVVITCGGKNPLVIIAGLVGFNVCSLLFKE